MKILLVLPNLPYPLDSGGNQAMFSMIDALRKEHDVSIMLLSNKHFSIQHSLETLWPDVKFHFSPMNTEWPVMFSEVYGGLGFRLRAYLAPSFMRKYFRFAYKHVPSHVDSDTMLRAKTLMNCNYMDFPYLKMYRDIVRLHEKEHFDIIQGEFANFTDMAYYLPDNVTKVFVHHEIAYVRRKNELELMGGDDVCMLAAWKKMRDAELAALAGYDKVIVLTDKDREILSSDGIDSSKIYVSPAVVASPCRDFAPCSRDYVFVGGSHHHPNMDGILWLCEEVLPILRSRCKDFRIHIVGQWNKKVSDTLKQNNPELVFEGFVDDLSAFLNGKISIVPIRIGSGMRMKILEAVYASSPFVTTVKGVEGQSFLSGRDCLVGDDAADFADAMLRLADNGSLQKNIAESALGIVREMYDPESMVRRRMDFYRSL